MPLWAAQALGSTGKFGIWSLLSRISSKDAGARGRKLDSAGRSNSEISIVPTNVRILPTNNSSILEITNRCGELTLRKSYHLKCSNNGIIL